MGKRFVNLFDMLCFQDHLVFPATEYNATQRPKMSFMIMAPPNSKLSLLAGGGDSASERGGNARRLA